MKKQGEESVNNKGKRFLYILLLRVKFFSLQRRVGERGRGGGVGLGIKILILVMYTSALWL
jgi:hypothetical protein